MVVGLSLVLPMVMVVRTMCRGMIMVTAFNMAIFGTSMSVNMLVRVGMGMRVRVGVSDFPMLVLMGMFVAVRVGVDVPVLRLLAQK